jgi:hypothetical protein
MIKELTYKDDCVFVHAGEISLKTTKAFTHGSIVFDANIRQVTFAKLPAVALPEGLQLVPGATLTFQLVAPDGELRPQSRSGVLTADEKQPWLFHIGGMAKTPRQFSAEDGWMNAVYKYRAYFKHAGLNTDKEMPEWLKGSILRQKQLWNRLAWLCREARRHCSPVASEEVIVFIKETIFPEIDAFNNSLGVSKEKMRYPAKLQVEDPGVDVLWRFVGELRGRIEKNRRVPDGLLEKVATFAKQFNADYTPLNEFLINFATIAETEAAALKLRRYEIRPIVTAFKVALDRRKKAKLSWSEGWPLIKYGDSPKSSDWGLHYYFNKAGVKSSLLETKEGVPGLIFGVPLNPADTGHTELGTWRGGKVLREAEISIPGDNRERWNFRFGVLQTRPLPANSHIKEWKLIFRNSRLYLCLVVEMQMPIPVASAPAAGLDIGWRRTEEGIRFGTLYEPVSWTTRELTIDLQKSPKDHKDRVPFRIDLGPTRWDKRNIALLFSNRKPGEEVRLTKATDSVRLVASLFPEWKPGDQIPNALEIKVALQNRRDYIKDHAKILLRQQMGESAPVWLDKAGRLGLLKLQEELKDNAEVQVILKDWSDKDFALGLLASYYVEKLTARLEYGQQQLAWDICRHLREKGITRLIVETSFIAKVAQRHDNEDPVSLKRSQKYRQFVAPGKFLQCLKQIAFKAGIVVETHDAMNTTRICMYCNHLNPATEHDSYQCEECHRMIKQDHNAAVNLSRFATDPELAAMAVNAKSEEEDEA